MNPKMVRPTTFNIDNNVLAPDTTKLLKFVLLLIDKVVVLDNELTLDDKTFKLLLVLLMFK
jgi:hypothetical protein